MTTASSYSELVQELYVAYFGRPADAAGLVNFENALLADGAPTDIASLANAYATNAAVKGLIDSFGTSAESTKLYGTVDSSLSSAEAFVTAVFEHVLNRAPAASGLAFWANAIVTGSLSIGNAALSIAVGAQTNPTAQGKLDAETIANKLAVASEFTTAVANPAGLDEYQGTAAANIGRTLLSNVDNTTDPIAYLASVQSAVASLLGTGTPYNLTTGVDNLTGATSNNLFNAVLDNAAGVAAGGAAATLNTGDTIVGGSGVNTLAINDEGVGSSMALPKGINLTNITDLSITTAESLGVQDFSTWSGLNAVIVNKSIGSAALTLGSATSLTLSDVGMAGSISTTGGSTIGIQTDAAHVVSVKGGSGTTSVAITGGSTIQITDGSYGTATANTIASVSFVNPGGATAIESGALTSLSVSGDTGEPVSVLTTAGNALSLNLSGDSGGMISENAQSLALTTSGTASTGINLQASSATALNLTLGANLTMAALNAPDVTSMTISGAGTFSADLRSLGLAAAINAADSSGAITVTVGGQESFVGGTGQVQLTTTGAPAATLDGGSATNNTIDFQNVVSSSSTAFATVKDFATWEISGSSSGTFNMANASGLQALDVQGMGGNLTISHVSATMLLTIDLASSNAYGVTLATSDSTGTSDAVTINLGSTGDGAQSLAQLTLQDNLGNGTGTLNLVSDSKGGAANAIATVTDINLHALNISGNAALEITNTLAEAAVMLAIDDTAGSTATTLTGLNDSTLAVLNIAGTQAVQLGAVSSSSTSLTMTDSGSGAASIGAFSDAALTSLSVSSTGGAVVTLTDASAPVLRTLTLTAGAQMTIGGDAVTNGITLSGANDNAVVSFTSTGATASGATDSVTLGNGSDFVTLGAGAANSTQSVTLGSGSNDTVHTSTQGKLNVTLGSPTSGSDAVIAGGNGETDTITVGNGSNLVTLSGSGDTVDVTAGSGANTITTGAGAGGAVSFAAHTAADKLDVGTIGQGSGAATIAVVPAASGVPAHLAGSLVVTGMNAAAADSIVFAAGAVSSVQEVTLTEVQSAGTSSTSLAGWIEAAVGQNGVVPQGAGDVLWFQEGGNTYLVDTASASDAGVLKNADTVVELSGTSYSFGTTSIGTGGVLLLNGGTGNSTPATATFTLTTGTDSFTGNASTNTFNATLGSGATLNAGDVLTGGASGSVNILNIVDSGTGGTMAIPGGATITGMTVLNIQSTEAVGGNYSSWSGLGTLNVTASSGIDNLTTGSNTLVTIVDSGTTVDLTGGESALIKDANYGTATANTLTTVALTDLSGAATIDSNALTSLTVDGAGFGATVNAAAGTRTLGITIDGAGSGATIGDATATTVNIGVSTAESSQSWFSFAAATSIAVTDAAGLNDSQTPWTAQAAFSAAAATSFTISGAGLFAANLTGLNAAASINASSSTGTIDVALSAGQSFTGGQGTDLVAVSGAPTGTISGGSAADNEIVLVNDGATSVSDVTSVTHFDVLGVSGNTSGTFDMSLVNGFYSFDVNQDTASAAIDFTNAETGSSLSIESNFANMVTLQSIDANGPTDSVNVTLGTAGGSAITVSGIEVMDRDFVGMATVSVNALSGATISTLFDNNIESLYLSGSAITITTLNTDSSAFTVGNDGSAAIITHLTANDLTGAVTLEGQASLDVGTLSSNAASLDIVDNNVAGSVIGTLSDNSLATLTLENNVNTADGTFSLTSTLDAPVLTLNLDGNVGLTIVDTAVPTGATGITVSGSTDNANVSFSSSDATPSGVTDIVTLGNGNDTVIMSGGLAGSIHTTTLGTGADTVTDGTAGTSNISVTGASGVAESVTANAAASVTFSLGDSNNTVSALAATTVSITAGNGTNSITATAAGAAGSITVGTGQNTIVTGASGALSISLGSHTAVDAITVGANASSSAISSITGIAAGDTISFAGDAGMSGSSGVVGITSGEVTANSGDTSLLADWVSASLANLAQHQVGTFVFGGNTFLVEQSASGNAQTLTGDTVIELIGTHSETGAAVLSHALTVA